MDEYDKKVLMFPPKFKKAKCLFLKKKASGHIDTAAMARTFVTGGQVAQSPSTSRLVEAIMLQLSGETVEQRAKRHESPYLSKWKVVVLRYNTLRNTVINSRLYKSTNLQLYPVNETTICKCSSYGSPDVGMTVPGLTQIEWTNVTEKSKLGEGSFGEVYSAKINDKLVIVKKLRRQKKHRERDLFAKEVRILRGLRCKHIVGVEGYCSNPITVIL
ncbi:Leucine rich repeat containing, partial [Paramuricea clavata]